jgi:hypothetical protein
MTTRGINRKLDRLDVRSEPSVSLYGLFRYAASRTKAFKPYIPRPRAQPHTLSLRWNIRAFRCAWGFECSNTSAWGMIAARCLAVPMPPSQPGASFWRVWV